MSTVHIIGPGFVGKSIADAVFLNTDYKVILHGRDHFDLTHITETDFLDLRSEDVVVFSAAKVPARGLDDIIVNLQMVKGFMKLIENQEFSYLLNISSDAVYPDQNMPIDEYSLTAPISYHGLMHIAREFILSDVYQDKLGHLRSTLIYGFGDPHHGYGPNQFIQKALNGQTISVFGHGEELRDHIYIKDVGYLATQMILNKVLGPVNAVTGETVSFKEIAQIICELVPSASIKYLERSTPIPHNGFRSFNASLAKALCPELFSFASIRDGLTRVFEQIGELNDESGN